MATGSPFIGRVTQEALRSRITVRTRGQDSDDQDSE